MQSSLQRVPSSNVLLSYCGWSLLWWTKASLTPWWEFVTHHTQLKTWRRVLTTFLDCQPVYLPPRPAILVKRAWSGLDWTGLRPRCSRMLVTITKWKHSSLNSACNKIAIWWLLLSLKQANLDFIWKKNTYEYSERNLGSGKECDREHLISCASKRKTFG